MTRRRVLLLTPTALPSITGNAVTVERLRRGLAEHGFDVRVLATEDLSPARLVEELRAAVPDLVHAYHAFKAGRLLVDPVALPETARFPWVVSLPGTDIASDVAHPGRRATIAAVCGRARAIATQGRVTRDAFAAIFPELADRLVLVSKAVLWLDEAPFDLRAAAGFGPGDLVFFHPAGIRPVKGNLECLGPLARVCAARPPARVRTVFAGPALDAAYGERFRAEVERGAGREFARWVAPVPLEAMRSAYDGADVVLNTSRSEGLSNVLLEAMAAGKPILASDVPGNRAVLDHAQAGLLYRLDDPEDLCRQALRLVDDQGLREALAAASRAAAARAPTPADEARAVAGVYEQALGQGRPEGGGSADGP